MGAWACNKSDFKATRCVKFDEFFAGAPSQTPLKSLLHLLHSTPLAVFKGPNSQRKEVPERGREKRGGEEKVGLKGREG